MNLFLLYVLMSGVCCAVLILTLAARAGKDLTELETFLLTLISMTTGWVILPMVALLHLVR